MSVSVYVLWAAFFLVDADFLLSAYWSTVFVFLVDLDLLRKPAVFTRFTSVRLVARVVTFPSGA